MKCHTKQNNNPYNSFNNFFILCIKRKQKQQQHYINEDNLSYV